VTLQHPPRLESGDADSGVALETDPPVATVHLFAWSGTHPSRRIRDLTETAVREGCTTVIFDLTHLPELDVRCVEALVWATEPHTGWPAVGVLMRGASDEHRQVLAASGIQSRISYL
jgi:hypothetical protein